MNLIYSPARIPVLILYGVLYDSELHQIGYYAHTKQNYPTEIQFTLHK